MADRSYKHYLVASDFDQTLTHNDTGYMLSEMIGIPISDFERKVKGMSDLNLVQQGAELAYLLLHDPEYRSKVRKHHLWDVGKRVRLKENVRQFTELLRGGIDGYQFELYVLSAAPAEVIDSALEGIVPPQQIFGTKFQYSDAGEVERVIQVTAGYGKVAVLDQIQRTLGISPDHIVYIGDGSSDVHAMLHVNFRDGLTIAVSETKHVSHIATRTVLSDNALAALIPILETVLQWDRRRIRELFASQGMAIQDWERVQTDWLTLQPRARLIDIPDLQ